MPRIRLLNGKYKAFPYTRKGYKQARKLKSKLARKRPANTERKYMGVPIGYPEAWKYVGRWREKKVGRGKWKISFRATKQRKAKSYGGFGRGTTGKWKINATQNIIKVGRGKYQTHLKGTKTSLGFKVKSPRRKKYF